MSDHPTHAETPALTVSTDLLRTHEGREINGQWTLQFQVGSGGMATVFAATDASGEQVAIKLMHAAQARDPLLRQRFIREAELMEAVEHPGSVMIYEYEETAENELYIAMELLEGEAVSDIWKRYEGRLPLELALDLGEQTLGFLSACHRLGIFHRDLKPSNLFLTREGVCKVLDFGVAHVETAGLDLTTPGQALGTPAFMSPEQAAGRLDLLDQRSDIFSLGATLYTLLSGQRLHEAASSQQAFVLAATSQAQSLARVAPDMPLPVIRMVDKATAWDPADRFQTTEEMRQGILDFLNSMRRGEEAASRGLSRGDVARVEALSAAALEDEEESADSDRLARVMRPVFQAVERTLGFVRRYSWDHPETGNRVSDFYDILSESLEDAPDGLQWSILPHSFNHRKKPIWEPEGLNEDIPYNLFAAGFRMMRILPGFDRGQLGRFLQWLTIDLENDLPPEDDLATMFWDMNLKNVEYRTVTSISLHNALGDDKSQFEELEEAAKAHMERSKEIARMVLEMGRESVLEAHAMQVGGRERFFQGVRNVEPRALERLRRHLDNQQEIWPDRLGRVLSAAYIDSVRTHESVLISEPMAELGRRYIRTGKFSELTAVYLQGVKSFEDAALKRQFVANLFSTSNLTMLLGAVASGALLQNGADEAVTKGLEELMKVLPEGSFDPVLTALTQCDDERIAAALVCYLERFIEGNEGKLGRVLQTASIPLSLELVRVLAKRPGSAALPVLRFGAKNPHMRVRVKTLEARAHYDGEDVSDELRALMQETDPKARIQALRVIGEYGIEQAAPVLAERCEERGFHNLPESERRMVLELLWELDREEGEDICLMLARRNMIPDKERNDTRAMAIQLLGARAGSDEAIRTVRAAMSWGWWNSKETRDVAEKALISIEGRFGEDFDD